jgi:hypothetical protein
LLLSRETHFTFLSLHTWKEKLHFFSDMSFH